jgi:hypothetical protein
MGLILDILWLLVCFYAVCFVCLMVFGHVYMTWQGMLQVCRGARQLAALLWRRR